MNVGLLAFWASPDLCILKENLISFIAISINMDVFRKGGAIVQKKTGCPSTPIQGQPNLHRDYSYIDVMENVKNFIQKLNFIHSFLKRSGFFRLYSVAEIAHCSSWNLRQFWKFKY